MASKLYSVLNPLVRAVLRSPFHRVLSGNTLLLEFSGRKSGRKYLTPVSYYRKGERVHCFASKESAWWRNLLGGAAVRIYLERNWLDGKARADLQESTDILPLMRDFLTAVPRDAPFAGVRLDSQKRPREDDLAKAVERLVLVTIEPDEPVSG